jgi:hypothetical protein
VLSHYFSLADLKRVVCCALGINLNQYKLLIFALWNFRLIIRKTVSEMSQLPGIGKEQQRACFA